MRYRPGQMPDGIGGSDELFAPESGKRPVYPFWGGTVVFRPFPALDESGNPLPAFDGQECTDWVWFVDKFVKRAGMAGNASFVIDGSFGQPCPYEIFHNVMLSRAGSRRNPRDPKYHELVWGGPNTGPAIPAPIPAVFIQGALMRYGDADYGNSPELNRVLVLNSKTSRGAFDQLVCAALNEQVDLVDPQNGYALELSSVTAARDVVLPDGTVARQNPHYRMQKVGPVPIRDRTILQHWMPWERFIQVLDAEKQVELLMSLYPASLVIDALGHTGLLPETYLKHSTVTYGSAIKSPGQGLGSPTQPEGFAGPRQPKPPQPFDPSPQPGSPQPGPSPRPPQPFEPSPQPGPRPPQPFEPSPQPGPRPPQPFNPNPQPSGPGEPAPPQPFDGLAWQNQPAPVDIPTPSQVSQQRKPVNPEGLSREELEKLLNDVRSGQFDNVGS